MSREIVLDTETTGFDPKTGDRLIEVGCIELMDLLPTGRTYHTLVHPERLIPPDSTRVHGITDEKVKDAPKFAAIVADLVAFIGDAPIIAHNAQFDRNFIDAEFRLCGHPVFDADRWIDSLQLAQKKFPGMPNSLDALCKRFKVSLADRTFHGALIDARLLAEVYLELRGGKERRLDLSAARVTAAAGPVIAAAVGARPRPLSPRSTETERAAHLEFLKANLKDHSLWEGYGLDMEKAPAA
ncbi:DNA polymerase III subunit epsilon [Brevundimonas sp. FT23028]|uniref:DNA polymerase III subunit epsilon n=1 Tax=Brevundimonas sp. FT23028 TaxID=3393748 RepID=UPI003B585E55